MHAHPSCSIERRALRSVQMHRGGGVGERMGDTLWVIGVQGEWGVERGAYEAGQRMVRLPSEESTYQGWQGEPTCTRATIAPAHGYALQVRGLLASARPRTYSRRAPPCPLPSHGRRARMEDVVLVRLDVSRPGGRAHPHPVLEQVTPRSLPTQAM